MTLKMIVLQFIVVLFVSIAEIAADSAPCVLPDGTRVMARWTNNKYYAGKVESLSSGSYNILFDDNDKISHSMNDISAVFPESSMQFGSHVIAPWKGSYKRFIGFVVKVNASKGFKVLFDDNSEAWYQENQLKILPEASSPDEVGARVFARWTNGLYYRGFVTKSSTSFIFVKYDDGDSITLPKLFGKVAAVLDKILASCEIKVGQRVIGYWPNRVRYYPGVVQKLCGDGNKYYVKFDDGDERCEELYEVRPLAE